MTQLVDAVVWNVYVPGQTYKHGEMAGQPLHAMVANGGNPFEVAQGVAEGRYELDLIGAITDYAWSQSFDRAYGKAARGAQDNLNEFGWNSNFGFQTGPWDDAQYDPTQEY